MLAKLLDKNRVLVGTFLAIFLSLITIFNLNKFLEAENKEFWVDESYGLKATVAKHSFKQIIVDGAVGQGSPAPLDYIVLKIFQNLRSSLEIDISELKYYRIWPIAITIFPAFIVLFMGLKVLFSKDLEFGTRTMYGFISVLLLLSYLFNETVYYYAAETRPYALWTVMWFVSLILSIENRKKLLVFSLSLLALSATASIFQLFSLFLASAICAFINKELDKKWIIDQMKIFTVPLLIVLYYCMKVGHHGYVRSTWTDFFDFWLDEFERFYIALIAIFVLLFKKETRKYSVAPIAMLISFLLGPLIFYITYNKGFFFTSRQYMYYNLAIPVSMLCLLKALPEYLHDFKNKKKKIILSVIALIVSCYFAYGKDQKNNLKKSKENILSFLKNN